MSDIAATLLHRCHNLLEEWYKCSPAEREVEIDSIVCEREAWDGDHEGVDEMIGILLEYRNCSLRDQWTLYDVRGEAYGK